MCRGCDCCNDQGEDGEVGIKPVATGMEKGDHRQVVKEVGSIGFPAVQNKRRVGCYVQVSVMMGAYVTHGAGNTGRLCFAFLVSSYNVIDQVFHSLPLGSFGGGGMVFFSVLSTLSSGSSLFLSGFD